jgi:hypothetical protein
MSPRRNERAGTGVGRLSMEFPELQKRSNAKVERRGTETQLAVYITALPLQRMLDLKAICRHQSRDERRK